MRGSLIARTTMSQEPVHRYLWMVNRDLPGLSTAAHYGARRSMVAMLS